MKAAIYLTLAAFSFAAPPAVRGEEGAIELDRQRLEEWRRSEHVVFFVEHKRFAEAVRVAASGSLNAEDLDEDSPKPPLDPEAAARIFNCLLTGTMSWDDEGGRRYVRMILRRRIGLLERACGLTDDQRQKIRLAGERDIAELLEHIAEHRRRFVYATTESLDETLLADSVREVPRLQSRLNSGPFNSDSFFAKIASISLTSEQLAKYERWRLRSPPAARRELPDLSR